MMINPMLNVFYDYSSIFHVVIAVFVCEMEFDLFIHHIISMSCLSCGKKCTVILFVLDKMATSTLQSEATFTLALFKKLYFVIANKVRVGEQVVLKDILK